jgi:hypothetical protein
MKLPVIYDDLEWWEKKQVREEYVKVPVPEEVVRKAPINRILFPKSFFKHPVHLHHCHKTGLTLGAVHHYCNAYLWQYLGE